MYQAEESEKAIPVLQKIVDSFEGKKSKELARYHHLLGKAYVNSENIDLAIKHYDAAFKIDLTNTAVLCDFGLLCYQQGDYDAAQRKFRALLLQKLDSSTSLAKADVYYYLGEIASKQGDAAKAASMLQRAVTEDKNHEAAQSALLRIKGH